MELSYRAIGQWCATFACSSVSEGSVVKIAARGTVAACNDGDAFAGTVESLAHDGLACSVALGGMVTAAYTGSTVPAAGFTKLAANGTGGVKVSETGNSYLVADVNTADKTVTFKL